MRLLLLLALAPALPSSAPYLDIAPFGTRSSGQGGTGIEWAEERDVREIRVAWARRPAHAKVEYWFRNWPYSPPRMPTIEDPVDDPWQGKWLTARTAEECDGARCRYTFEPLATGENPRAANLPGVQYRRTLKVRVTSADGEAGGPAEVYTESREAPLALHIRFDAPAQIDGIEVYNGRPQSCSPARGGADLLLVVSRPLPPGSNDITVVTVRARPHTFSFSTADVEAGPVRIPDFGVTITAGVETAAPPAGPPRIREMIPREPEQTYERASREIPPLDPWHRQNGDRVYLPLAADASWQKFAVEYGGNVFISKRGTKAKGGELERLRWQGDRLTWMIGTGAAPYYRGDGRASVSVLEGDLPVVIQSWENDGLRYSEETWATLLRGPLSPNDAARGEETPAVLMLKITAENPATAPRKAHVWLSTEPGEPLRLEGRRLLATTGPRAVLDRADTAMDGGRCHIVFEAPASGSASTVIKLPFVGDLDEDDLADLERLDYEEAREETVTYWRRVRNAATRLSVPEPRFERMLRAVASHIRISAAKDPESGLYIVPAASYDYQEFANEACYQAMLLDQLGDHATASKYLETLLRLQGSRDFPGVHGGPADAVFHGAKVDQTYDYTASGYGLDHGTVLWALAEHYLYTRDAAWFDHAWPHMRLAAEWIASRRASTGNGLLPASQLEDNSDWAQWFAVNAFAWAGLDRTASALADRNHPEAPALRTQADRYRADLRAAIQRAWEAAPVTRLRDGTYAPYVPTHPRQRFRLFGPLRTAYYSRYGVPGAQPTFRLSATREALYGPLLLLTMGVFSPGEPVADWILDDWEDNLTLSSGLGLNVHGLTDDRFWFSQGGMVFQANLQNPAQVYLRRHEAPAAIRSLYNAFAACLYPDAGAFTEEFRMWTRGSGPFYKAPDEARFVSRLRDTLVLEDGETLWLASGTPRRWLAAPEGIRVERAATHFGPVSYAMAPGKEARTIEATVELPSRNPARAAWLVVRAPEGSIREATVNGRPTRIDASHEAVELPAAETSLRIVARY